MYNKYSYMSDLYLIPRTCTRTCSIIRISGVCGRSFLKIDVWVGVGIPRGPAVDTLSHGRRCVARVCVGRPMRVDKQCRLILTSGRGIPTPRSRRREVLCVESHCAGESNQKTKLRKTHIDFGLETTVNTPRKSP